MEYSHNALLSLIICVVVFGSQVHALLSGEEYWLSLWPNTSLPKTLRDLAPPGVWTKTNSIEHSITSSKTTHFRKLKVPHNTTSFFLEQDLQAGTKKTLIRAVGPYKCFYSYQSTLESEHESDNEGADTSTTLLKWCLNSSSSKIVQDAFCATSFESLINFPISMLGMKIEVLPKVLEKKSLIPQVYEIEVGVKEVGKRAVVCHKLKYPSAVFYCHDVLATRAYEVPLLVASDGTKTKALAVCHIDTSDWDPNHRAFQVLKVKPGTVPVCHFLSLDALLWFIST